MDEPQAERKTQRGVKTTLTASGNVGFRPTEFPEIREM